MIICYQLICNQNQLLSASSAIQTFAIKLIYYQLICDHILDSFAIRPQLQLSSLTCNQTNLLSILSCNKICYRIFDLLSILIFTKFFVLKSGRKLENFSKFRIFHSLEILRGPGMNSHHNTQVPEILKRIQIWPNEDLNWILYCIIVLFLFSWFHFKKLILFEQTNINLLNTNLPSKPSSCNVVSGNLYLIIIIVVKHWKPLYFHISHSKELSLCHKLCFSKSYIFGFQCRKP